MPATNESSNRAPWRGPAGWRRTLACALAAYLLSTALMCGGTWVGLRCLRGWLLGSGAGGATISFGSQFFKADGVHYWTIADEGYSYDPSRVSVVAFFPLYPVLSGLLARATGIPLGVSLLLISHGFLLAALVMLHRYAGLDAEAERHGYPGCAVFCMALYPVALFARMAYTEPLFIFLCVAALYAIRRQVAPVWVALIVALATATRPPGVALVVPLALYAWKVHQGGWKAVRALAWLVPLSCVGILAYMVYLGVEFGNPLAFAQTQEHYRTVPRVGLLDHLLILASWEPIWSVYRPGSPGYWAGIDGISRPWYSLQFANPIFFVLAAVLLAVGIHRRWLNRYEAALAAGLLLIPYVTRSYEMAMASHARFTLVVFPIFLVMARLLVRLPVPVRIAALGLSAAYLAVYSAMLGAGRILI